MELSLKKVRSAAVSTLKKLSPAKLANALNKESEVSRRLHAEVGATLRWMLERDPGLAQTIQQAYGFAVFPSVGRAAVALGCSYGLGEVFKHGKLIGYAALVQLTVGVQVGGQTFSELVLFQDENALDRFKQSKVGFAANASTVIVKAGAAATNDYKSGMQVFVASEGGLMLELAIGAQKLVFRPAALTRGKSADLPEMPEAQPEEQQEPAAVAAPETPAPEAAAPQTPAAPEAAEASGARPEESQAPPAKEHAPGRLFDGTDESAHQWKLVGAGELHVTDGALILAAASEPGLLYYVHPDACRFDDFRLRLQYRPEPGDFDMSVAARFLDPEQPVPDRDDPSLTYPYDNQAFVAAHTGFEVHLGPRRPGAEAGTFEGILLGQAPGAQQRGDRAEVKVGDWNELELDVEENRFTVRLNGKETAQFTNSDSYRGKPASADPRAGFVGLLMRKGRMAVRDVELEERPPREQERAEAEEEHAQAEPAPDTTG
jgi:lipid-binding SYLF domain-containing protein